MTYFNFDKLENLVDGDILFFDELLNGNPVVLNACLTILEQRKFISGKPLPNIMVVAAANPQGMTPLTPQIKERFVWYNVSFDSKMWTEYMFKKYGLVKTITNKLINLIQSEDFTTNNFYTPRSIDKAVNMVIHGIPTPYKNVITPILESLIRNNTDKNVILADGKELAPNEQMPWLQLIRLKGNIILSNEEEEDLMANGHEIQILDPNDNIIGEVENIEKLKLMYSFTENALKALEAGEKISHPAPARPGSLLFSLKINN